ncbi:MAG: prepilin-type N-terminal cleavage/methylation domain-containing protein, partial [Fimbriimonadaceae bacterium]|nr:prepilin-type N-terminal cleavage/methylation domain-containing protein [Fimbriimonadaceae bacterium]
MRKGRFAHLSAFTLIELLTVIAITGVLLTLVIVPIVQSFNLTRSAQGFADAQDKARRVVERVSREVGNSAGIRDNSGIKGALAVRLPGQNGADTMQLLEYLKIDIIKPAEGDPIRGAGGALINPNTGRADPTQVASKGQVVLPVTPGDTIARYFVGRRDPFRGYTNPYDGLLMQQSSARDNLYVLFRVEYQPY